MKLRARAVAGVIGAVALLGGLASLSWLAAGQHRTRAAVVPSAQRAAVRQAPAAPTVGASGLALSAAAPVASAAPIENVAVPGPGEVEVCGFGIAKADSEAASALAQRANADLEPLLQSHLQSMLGSADVKTRAAALMAAQEFAPLVELALRNGDPTVYAFAQQACNRRAVASQASQSCQMLSAEQAARLDPDNAALWLQVAGEADRRKDADAVAAALHRASLATTFQRRAEAFFSLAVAALPPQQPLAQRVPIVVRLMGIQGGLAGPNYHAAVTYCSAARVTDSNRRQTCAALAEVLVAKGTSMFDFAIGRHIGERVGWPQDRVERLHARFVAYQQAFIAEVSSAQGGPMSCAIFHHAEQWWLGASSRGDRIVAEEAIARAGLSEAQLMARYRVHLRQRAEAAASAAASAAR